MGKHEKYSLSVSFIICEGLKDKALEELRDLINHINHNSLSHVSELKVKVNHESIEG